MTCPYPFRTLWIWHSLCCLVALLCCVALLWPAVFLPDAWEERIISYAGATLLCSVLGSALLLALTAIALLLRLHYRRALRQIVAWAAQWAVAGVVFTLLAWLADVPPPKESATATAPIQAATDTPALPNSALTGPDALFIRITPEACAAVDVARVQNTPNLSLLEREHSELLGLYLSKSPRWAVYMDDDTFYTKPGHVVMTPAISEDSIQGLVHVAFRHLVEGDPLPVGYTIVKPGSPMPAHPEGSEQVADLAVDLGRNHYLMLAWRGTSHTETAYRAINAAIAAVDAMVEPLAAQPHPDTVESMLLGKRNIAASTPELLLNQPPSQYGAYQAEIYVNPGEAGTLILRVAELETDTTLRVFTCQALYSARAGELFRHDIPGSTAAQHAAASSIFGRIPGLLPAKAHLFVIKQGEAHQFFDVACEVWFQPASTLKPRRLLLRRLYRVQAYEAPGAPEPVKDEPAPQATEPLPPDAVGDDPS